MTKQNQGQPPQQPVRPPLGPPVPPRQTPPDVQDRADAVDDRSQSLAREPKTLKDLLTGDKFLKAVTDVAPKVMRPDRFVRAALTAMMRIPKLAECTRESFFLAMLNCAFYGLEPDGRRAHLIPFKNKKVQPNVYECNLIIDYKGLVELVMRSGDVSSIHCDAVFPGDEFECVIGTNGHLTHKLGDDRIGKPLRVYSYVRLKDGGEVYDVMSIKEVDRIRQRSKTPDEGPWVTDYVEMAKKTIFRRHSKWLPLSPESKFNLERGDSEAIDMSGWTEVLEGAAEQPQRLTARESVMNPPPLPAHDGSGVNEELPGEPTTAAGTEPAQPADPSTSAT